MSLFLSPGTSQTVTKQFETSLVVHQSLKWSDPTA